MKTFRTFDRGDTNEIKKLMKKGINQKKRIIRHRREESYLDNVKEWKSKKGSVGNMIGDSHWGYSPTYKSNVRPFKPQRLTESQRFNMELDEIIRELDED